MTTAKLAWLIARNFLRRDELRGRVLDTIIAADVSERRFAIVLYTVTFLYGAGPPLATAALVFFVYRWIFNHSA